MKPNPSAGAKVAPLKYEEIDLESGEQVSLLSAMPNINNMDAQEKTEVVQAVALEYEDLSAQNKQLCIATMRILCVAMLILFTRSQVKDEYKEMIDKGALFAMVAALMASLRGPLSTLAVGVQSAAPRELLSGPYAEYVDSVTECKAIAGQTRPENVTKLSALLKKMGELARKDPNSSKNPGAHDEEIEALREYFRFAHSILSPVKPREYRLLDRSPRFEVASQRYMDQIIPTLRNVDPESRKFLINEVLKPLCLRKLTGANVQFKNIYFIGPPSSGKSTFIENVSRIFGIPIIDLNLVGFSPVAAQFRAGNRFFNADLVDIFVQALKKARALGADTIIIPLDELRVLIGGSNKAVADVATFAAAGAKPAKPGKPPKPEKGSEGQTESTDASAGVAKEGKKDKGPKPLKMQTNQMLIEYFLKLLGNIDPIRRDHYTGLSVDTSAIKVLFIAAGNDPLEYGPLYDRFVEIVTLAPEEDHLIDIFVADIKRHIAQEPGVHKVVAEQIKTGDIREKVREAMLEFKAHYKEIFKGEIPSRILSKSIINRVVYSKDLDQLFPKREKPEF